MSTPADVAIVVRTKDRPDFLARALRSITGQTLTNWECVIVNDGGDANAVDARIGALPPAMQARIRAIHVPVARGRWKSANAGVLATAAPLLVLHDDDDAWHPEFLLRATQYLAHHAERDGVVARTEIRWESKSVDDSFVTTRTEIFQPHLHDLLLTDALLFNRYVPIGFVYRRSLHEELGLYNDALPVVGDWAFNLKVLAKGPIEYLSETPLAYWHQRTNANGADGNSVIASRDDHARYDALIRDEALREYVAREGIGLPLYLTAFIDRRFVEVENGIRSEIAQSSLWRRVGRRLRRR